jgi:hypothetical protein
VENTGNRLLDGDEGTGVFGCFNGPSDYFIAVKMIKYKAKPLSPSLQ